MIFTRNLFLWGLLVLQLSACSTSPQQSSSEPGVIAGGAGQGSQMGASQNPYLLERQAVPKRAQLAFEQAVGAMRTVEWKAAEQSLLELTEAYPDLSGPWLNLGIVYLRTAETDRAASAFASAINANSNNLDAYNQLAALKRSKGDFAAAQRLYQRALAIWPEHADSHLNLGMLYDIYMGQFEQAALHYRAYQALQDEPDRRVAGWLMDLNRRPQMLARAGQEQ
jgi:tetratricopeptide (TPR) repeat protein